MRIKLPTKFYLDHADRGLPSGSVIRTGKNVVEVDVTQEELDEIEEDALYYADTNGPDCQPNGLKASAKRTVERIKAFKKLPT